MKRNLIKKQKKQLSEYILQNDKLLDKADLNKCSLEELRIIAKGMQLEQFKRPILSMP